MRGIRSVCARDNECWGRAECGSARWLSAVHMVWRSQKRQYDWLIIVSTLKRTSIKGGSRGEARNDESKQNCQPFSCFSMFNLSRYPQKNTLTQSAKSIATETALKIAKI